MFELNQVELICFIQNKIEKYLLDRNVYPVALLLHLVGYLALDPYPKSCNKLKEREKKGVQEQT